LKVENLKFEPAKPRVAQVKSAATAASAGSNIGKPGQSPGKLGLGATGTRNAVAGEERRRSQRVLLRVRVNIHVPLQGRISIFEVGTLSVNDHGALIVAPRSLALDSHLTLEHCLTKRQISCRVVRSPREMPEGFHTPLEFETPEPNFWGIAFPPSDWRPLDDT